MGASIFDLAFQHTDIQSKIIIGLERVSEVFRTLLWDLTKETGLSPIQIQIIIFLNRHEEHLCNVSHLAREFNLSKPTISDAIKALSQKDLVEKHPSPQDKRAYTLHLNSKGKKLVQKLEAFVLPLKNALGKIHKEDQVKFFTTLNQLIYDLNQQWILECAKNLLWVQVL